mgnify:FL=1
MKTNDIGYWYERYADELFAYGIAFCIDREIVLDAIQDVFLYLYENQSKIQDPNNVKFYLFTSLKNRIISILRKESQFQELTDEYQFELCADAQELTLESEEKAQYENLLNQLLSLLTSKQREAIYLHYMQNLSYEDVAQILNITPKSTRKLIYRAIQKMQEELPIYFVLLLLLTSYKYSH